MHGQRARPPREAGDWLPRLSSYGWQSIQLLVNRWIAAFESLLCAVSALYFPDSSPTWVPEGGEKNRP